MTAAVLDKARTRWSPQALRRLLNRLVWLILTVLVAAIAALAIFVKTGHGAITPVLSGSMRPGIQAGDVVVTQRVSVTSLKVNDIIVFVPPGGHQAKVHRIHTLQKRADGSIVVTTKGDYNSAIDPWGSVIMRGHTYRASFHISKVGWLVDGGLRWVVLGLIFGGAALVAHWTIKYVRS